MRQDIQQLSQPNAERFPYRAATNKSLGRLEERRLTTSGLLRDYVGWPYLEQVFQLELHVVHFKTGQVQNEVVHGITSLQANEADPERLLKINRDHWGIENGLHYRRDKTLREDATRTSHPTFGAATAILNNLVIGLTFLHGWHNLPQARRHYNARLQDALNVVLRRPT